MNLSALEWDVSDLTLLVMSLVAFFTVVHWHRSSGDFHLQQVLIDGKTGRISIEKVAYMTSLFFGTWGFVALIQQGQMTEGYFAAYLAVFAVSRAASIGASVYSTKTFDKQP